LSKLNSGEFYGSQSGSPRNSLSTKFRLAAGACFGSVALAIILFSPIFLVTAESVTIVGINNISADTVMQALAVPQNILFVPDQRVRDALIALDEVDSVVIQKRFPNIVEVQVYEKQLSGYVPYLQDYLCVDHECRVRYITDEALGLPVIYGLRFDGFRLGETLTVKNNAAFDTAIFMLKLLSKYDIDYIYSIDVADSSNIILGAYNMNVEFGATKYADEKLRTLNEILDQLPDARDMAGVLDISNIKRHYIFKVLT
jgi:cell division septal protein FtsQ